jgi:hypothetical protein
MDFLQNVREVVWRDIAGAEEWFEVGGEEHIVGPPALAGHEFRGQHVQTIDIRAAVRDPL